MRRAGYAAFPKSVNIGNAKSGNILSKNFFRTQHPTLANRQAPGDGPDWPGALKGRHRQVVDAYEANSGFPLAFDR